MPFKKDFDITIDYVLMAMTTISTYMMGNKGLLPYIKLPTTIFPFVVNVCQITCLEENLILQSISEINIFQAYLR